MKFLALSLIVKITLLNCVTCYQAVSLIEASSTLGASSLVYINSFENSTNSSLFLYTRSENEIIDCQKIEPAGKAGFAKLQKSNATIISILYKSDDLCFFNEANVKSDQTLFKFTPKSLVPTEIYANVRRYDWKEFRGVMKVINITNVAKMYKKIPMKIEMPKETIWSSYSTRKYKPVVEVIIESNRDMTTLHVLTFRQDMKILEQKLEKTNGIRNFRFLLQMKDLEPKAVVVLFYYSKTSGKIIKDVFNIQILSNYSGAKVVYDFPDFEFSESNVISCDNFSPKFLESCSRGAQLTEDHLHFPLDKKLPDSLMYERYNLIEFEENELIDVEVVGDNQSFEVINFSNQFFIRPRWKTVTIKFKFTVRKSRYYRRLLIKTFIVKWIEELGDDLTVNVWKDKFDRKNATLEITLPLDSKFKVDEFKILEIKIPEIIEIPPQEFDNFEVIKENSTHLIGFFKNGAMNFSLNYKIINRKQYFNISVYSEAYSVNVFEDPDPSELGFFVSFLGFFIAVLIIPIIFYTIQLYKKIYRPLEPEEHVDNADDV